MTNWKIKRSKQAGVKPNVNQFPSSEHVIWNEKDGKLWGLRIDGDGNRHVELIGGGINTIGQTHARLHQMDSEHDHAASPANAGRIIILNEAEGKPVYINAVAFNPEGLENPPRITIEKNYTTGEMVFDVNEAGIDHNNLKNFQTLRHKRMEYKADHKAYFVEP